MNVPQSEEAEERVLGAMLVGNQAVIREVLDVLEPLGERKFYRPSFGEIYSVIRGLWSDGKGIDPMLVAERLPEGMRLKLGELVGLVTSTANVGFHAGIVRDKWSRRELVAVGQRLADNSETATDPLADAERELSDAADLIRRDKKNAVATIGDLTTKLVLDLQSPLEQPPGFAAPLACMPRLIPGRVYVSGAYTGHGKTIVGRMLASSVCEHGGSVTYHSLEMSKEDIRNRFVASYGVPLTQLDQGKIRDDFWPNLLTAGQTMMDWKLRIIDDSSVLSTDVLRYQRGLRSDLIVFDHIHQMELGNKGDHRLALNEQLRRFVSIAKSEHVPVVLLAQLRRRDSLSGGAFPRPHLKDLKESGAIEENASYVGFVWRHTDDDGVPVTEAEWIVGKDRFGRVAPPSRIMFKPDVMGFSQPM